VMALDGSEVQRSLADLPGWSGGTEAISKEYRFKGFKAAVGFVQSLVEPANAARHHPDIDIRYNRVLITLSTHDEGGVTEADISMAHKIEDLAESSAPGG
jgi:4a-hydroxytetrahydrobiopterin dehydratase